MPFAIACNLRSIKSALNSGILNARETEAVEQSFQETKSLSDNFLEQNLIKCEKINCQFTRPFRSVPISRKSFSTEIRFVDI